MTRTIKFRAWTGQMQYDIMVGRFGIFYVNPGEKGDGLDVKDTASLTPFNTKIDEKSCQIMQFTGFLDKNGKEVYEGDIVEAFSQGIKRNLEVRWRQEIEPCFMLYPAWIDYETWSIHASHHSPGKTWVYANGKTKIDTEEYFMDDGLVVIGNIYENPELLQNAK